MLGIRRHSPWAGFLALRAFPEGEREAAAQCWEGQGPGEGGCQEISILGKTDDGHGLQSRQGLSSLGPPEGRGA